MKKTLVALAALAVMGAASAQSTVSIYGLIDTALIHTTETNQPSKNAIDSGTMATSKFGFKGSEDLGGGLKANFKLEQAFKSDTGAATAGTAFSREAWVGLSGGFGEVKLGKVSSAYNDIESAAGALWGSGVLGPIGLVFESDLQEDARPKNTIYYATPTFSGVTGSVSYSMDEAVGGSTVKSVGLAYAQGPLYVGAGFQSQQDFGNAVQVQMSQLNATYDLASVKLLGALGRVANSKGVTGDTATEWQVGADMPVSSALTVSVGYASSTTDFLAAAVADAKHTAFSVGGMYALSKRTMAYAGISSDKLDTTNVTVNKYAVGVKHSF